MSDSEFEQVGSSDLESLDGESAAETEDAETTKPILHDRQSRDGSNIRNSKISSSDSLKMSGRFMVMTVYSNEDDDEWIDVEGATGQKSEAEDATAKSSVPSCGFQEPSNTLNRLPSGLMISSRTTTSSNAYRRGVDDDSSEAEEVGLDHYDYCVDDSSQSELHNEPRPQGYYSKQAYGRTYTQDLSGYDIPPPPIPETESTSAWLEMNHREPGRSNPRWDTCNQYGGLCGCSTNILASRVPSARASHWQPRGGMSGPSRAQLNSTAAPIVSHPGSYPPTRTTNPQFNHSLAPNVGTREILTEDALQYLADIKATFAQWVYREFLDIAGRHNNAEILTDTVGTIRRIYKLFVGYKFILGFNHFLPSSHQISIKPTTDSRNVILTIKSEKEGVPFNSEIVAVSGYNHGYFQQPLSDKAGEDGRDHPYGTYGADYPTVLQGSPQPSSTGVAAALGAESKSGALESPDNRNTRKNSIGQPGIDTTSPEQQQQQNKKQEQEEVYQKPPPSNFNHAISYVNTVKERFANDPNTYLSFLQILTELEEGKVTIMELMEQMTMLFADHPDLVKRFIHFLPEGTKTQAYNHVADAQSGHSRGSPLQPPLSGGASDSPVSLQGSSVYQDTYNMVPVSSFDSAGMSEFGCEGNYLLNETAPTFSKLFGCRGTQHDQDEFGSAGCNIRRKFCRFTRTFSTRRREGTCSRYLQSLSRCDGSNRSHVAN